MLQTCRENQHFVAYKQARRREDDIAIVNAAFNVTLDGNKVSSLRMAFGGMAATTRLALDTALALQGRYEAICFLALTRIKPNVKPNVRHRLLYLQ